jgi:hypothetical protein
VRSLFLLSRTTESYRPAQSLGKVYQTRFPQEKDILWRNGEPWNESVKSLSMKGAMHAAIPANAAADKPILLLQPV